MNNEFDILWEKSQSVRCPLSDETVEMMVAKAMQRSSELKPLKHHRIPRRPWLVATAVAAASAAVVVPVAMTHQIAPKQVDYNGQSVSFIGNNGCEADSIINALDTYLANL